MTPDLGLPISADLSGRLVHWAVFYRNLPSPLLSIQFLKSTDELVKKIKSSDEDFEIVMSIPELFGLVVAHDAYQASLDRLKGATGSLYWQGNSHINNTLARSIAIDSAVSWVEVLLRNGPHLSHQSLTTDII